MAVAFVQGIGNTNTTTSMTVTLGAAPSSGNLLLAFVTHGASTLPTGTPSGSGWGAVTTINASGGTARAAGVWWKLAGAGESATITYSAITLTGRWSMVVVEYSGIDNVTPVNQILKARASSTTTNGITNTAVDGLAVFIASDRATTSATAWSAHAYNTSTTGVTARVNNNQNNQAGTTGLSTAWDYIGVLPTTALGSATVTSPVSDSGCSCIGSFNAAAVVASTGLPDLVMARYG